MVKMVIDANVLISAAFGGIPLEAVSKAFSVGKVYLSPDIVSEIEETVHRLTPKLGDEKSKVLLALWRRFHSLCEVHKPSRKVVVCRDPKDDAYLSLCAEVMADFLVTGDKDLLVVDPAVTQGLPSNLKILTPRQFLELEY
jgi:putative PIN family toxin of toxin-antitoxin system